MHQCSAAWCKQGCLAIALLALGQARCVNSAAPDGLAPAAKITFDLSKGHAMAEHLWGIFFEEISHAGDGGLYAEMISDRSFGGLAYALGLSHSEATHLAVPARFFEHEYFPIPPAVSSSNLTNARLSGWASAAPSEYSLQGQPRSWLPVGKTAVTLVRQQPINAGGRSSTAYIKISTDDSGGGLTNTGYWGIPVEKDQDYQLAVIIQSEPSGDVTNKEPRVTAKLESETGKEVYASADLGAISNSWSHSKVMLTSNATDAKGQLTLYVEGEADVAVRLVSLFPAENVKGAVLQPFRPDLLQYLKDLQPRFVRMPGGCYVEGVRLETAAWWKPSIGPFWERPGHYNSVWNYWSTDGMGVFEYFQLAEALDAEPVWVINNGIAHEDSIPAAHIWPLVQDALDLIEFVSGAADSEWGSLRNKMGRSEPWDLNYFAIGNEDCGKPWYVENYIAFFTAIRSKYPHMRLISNCDMDDHAPTDLFDWHMYTDPQNMFDRRHDFDNVPNLQDKQIFASEFGVVSDRPGTPISFPGNARAAIAEAGFMTGVERNSEQVAMAAFAPLFSNWNDRVWPHNLIIFDNHRVFGTVSYYVQKLFSVYQGVRYIETDVSYRDGDSHNHGVAASASCQNTACTKVAFKMVNFNEASQTVDVEVKGLSGGPTSMVVTTLNSTDGTAENTFDTPFLVSPKQHKVKSNGPMRNVTLPAYSLTIVSIDTSSRPSITQA
ncbi:TPA: aspartate-semialdehyde dehydrogenase-like protein [Trebouxia sp. C0005]